jgi:hypothetical protein
MEPLANGHLSASGNAAAEPFWPVADLPSTQFQLLTTEQQLALDGRAEPLLASVASVESEVASVDSAQLDAFRQDRQLPLPLPTRHQLTEDGKAHADCMSGRGWELRFCPFHPGEPHASPRLCGCQDCESSREANTRERARDAFNGTADDVEDRLALRHFTEAPWGVFVWTVPAELRHLCVGDRLRAWRKAVGALTLEVLRRHGAGAAEFYARSWFHPVGEPELPPEDGEGVARQPEDGTVYKPHENVLVPLLAYRAGGAHRLKPMLPKSWLGAGGWVGERYREVLVEVFGQWWASDAPAPNVNWFYGYRDTIEKQQHALRYFARVFPGWAKHAQRYGAAGVSVRPRAFALAHWKHKDALRELVSGLTPAALYGACRHASIEAPCPPPVRLSASTEAGVLSQREQWEATSRESVGSSYPEEWRIMTGQGSTARPEHGPPGHDPPVSLPNQRRWHQFPTLRA